MQKRDEQKHFTEMGFFKSKNNSQQSLFYKLYRFLLLDTKLSSDLGYTEKKK